MGYLEYLGDYIIIFNSIIYYIYPENRDIIVMFFCPPLINVFAAL